MTLDDTRISRPNHSAEGRADSITKATRILVLPKDDLSRIDRAVSSHTSETQELTLPEADLEPDQAARQHIEHTLRLVLPQVDVQPATLPDRHDPPARRSKSLYFTLATLALLLLTVLAVKWRTKAFEHRAARSTYELPVLTQELRYHMPEAGEVFVIWGINGWTPVSESLRPPGTRIENGKMTTSTERQGDVFVATIQAPANATIEYGFKITADRRGHPIPSVWDQSPEYHLLSVLNRTIEIEPSVTLENR
jgi:hypothetical protein